MGTASSLVRSIDDILVIWSGTAYVYKILPYPVNRNKRVKTPGRHEADPVKAFQVPCFWFQVVRFGLLKLRCRT